MNNSQVEEKGIIEFLIKKYEELINVSPLFERINELIAKEYSKGIEEVEKQVKPNINFVPKEKDLEFLQEYVIENIQKNTDLVGDNLRQEIQRSIMNKENVQEMTERIKLIFKEKKYMDRLKAVIRTETQRANNQGRLEGAIQAEESGLKLAKWIDIILDDRTSKICKLEDSKYGSPDKAIPIDEDFIITADNKIIKSKNPPFHVNCRSVLRIVIIGRSK